MNSKDFIKALAELASSKGIATELILDALKEAMEKAYIKQLNAGDDALVKVEIDAKKGIIEMFQLKKIVEDVQDDFIEISLDEARKFNQNYQLGDFFRTPVSIEEISKVAALSAKQILRQKIAEAEKAALYEIYQDKIGEMINGVVEKVDERSAIVNLGRTSVYLPMGQKIPGEHFNVGQTLKLYVVDVVSTTKGAQIAVSRSDAGFLRRLFEEEIHEIYDGTVIIKDIAREPGERSKVAVYTTDVNVDPTGACIGPNGSRIQKIVAQLGNAKEKEKIDIIAYNENPGLYIMEALKPAQVTGVVLNREEKKAVAVVNNGQLSLAIGKKGVNARLAVKLTSWNIDIKEMDDALAMGLKPLTAEELRRDEEYYKRVQEQQRYIDSITPTVKDEIPADFVAPVAEPVVDVKVEAVATPVVPVVEVKEEVKVVPVVEEKPVVVAPVMEEKPIEVRTTKTLEQLERELEMQKERQRREAERAARKTAWKKSFEDRNSDNNSNSSKEDVKVTVNINPELKMDIYTEEELKALEAEETVEDTYYEEVDYDDFDAYYDEEK